MKNKFVLITGASGSIGQETAIELARQGYSLYLHYHTNKTAIDALMKELQVFDVEMVPIQADLSTNEGVEVLCSNIFSINSLVLNSGKAHYGLVSDVDIHTMNEMMAIHITSPFFIVQKLLPKLMKEESSSIVAVTSIWGDTGASCEVLYSMLKGGQNAFVKALSKELAPMGVRVNAVSPGAVETPMLQTFSDDEKQELADEIPLGRLAQPEEIAHCIAYLLSNKSSYITGHVLKVNGGWYM
ncbi:elongation factor P 5-aminopentanone reductase [Bacillus sp. JJ722]|uniref:elongation factor P 5-aminopentanone reductase n=1 Tax=Bacillus sp. JJ722 TaxID=3122973 RepID=UPI002FFF6F76